MWQMVQLGEICDVLDKLRKPITKKDRVEGDYPYYGATGIVDWIVDYIFDEKLVLVGEDGAKWGSGDATAFIATGKYWVNNHAHVLRPKSELVIHEWISYYLTGIDLSEFVTGLTVPKLNQANLKTIPIPLPPLAEQQRIVAKLDAAFAEIDAAIELSKKQAISASDYGYRIIKTTLAELSEQHGLSSLSNTAVIQPKKKLALAKLNEDDDVSFMGMDGLGIEKKYSQPKTIKKLSEVYKSYQYFEDNDVIFAKITPCFENGKLSIVKGLTNGVGFGSSEFVVLRTHATFQPEFLYYCLLDEVFRNDGADNMSGAVGHKRVTKEYFSNYSVPTPPLDVQQLISKKFDEVWKNTKSIVSAKHKKIEELTNLKSAILKQELQSEAA